MTDSVRKGPPLAAFAGAFLIDGMTYSITAQPDGAETLYMLLVGPDQ